MSNETPPNYSALRSAKRQNLSEIVPLNRPFTIYLEPTNVCNFSCSYCPVHFEDYFERSGGRSKLDVKACAMILDQILELGRLKTLNFYMLGEPYANRDLPTFIRMAKDRDVAERIIVTSNATLLSEAMARQTLASGLDYLRVSIYGADQARHEAVTGSKTPLERIVENVRRLKLIRDDMGLTKPHIYVKMIDGGDAVENQRFLSLFAPISDAVAIEPVMNWNLSEFDNDISGAGAQLTTSSHFALKKTACPFPFYSLVINSDLRVTVCCVDWEKATKIGDLREQTLAEIWRGQALRDFQLKHLRGERDTIAACRSCTFLHTAPDQIDDLDAATYLERVAM